MGKTIQEAQMATERVIFMLQHLGFIINQKKSILVPQQTDREFESDIKLISKHDIF